jgi:predicted amino acid racemase
MGGIGMYPRIMISLPKLISNAQTILSLCKRHGVSSIFLVGKVLAGYKEVLGALAPLGFTYLADSRMDNLKKFHEFSIPKALTRIPMLSEIKDVIKYSSLALVSEIKTIEALSQEAIRQEKNYDVILMFDLGDLREGVFYKEDYMPLIKAILHLPNIHLKGIGTNLTCLEGVIPDQVNMGILVDIKNKIENAFEIHLDLVSGGNSSTLYMLDNLPSQINNLRIGEAIFLGRETAFGNLIPGMFQDAFTLEAEIVEIQRKPSHPIGTLSINAFGETPILRNSGEMNRAILAIGKQDVDHNHLTPHDSTIKSLESNSDYLIIQLEDNTYHLGDIVSFSLDYASLLQCMSSHYVRKILLNS